MLLVVLICFDDHGSDIEWSGAPCPMRHAQGFFWCLWMPLLGDLAGNVADMSRHVGDDTTCCSNFGQMGPCRRHKIEDVVAVCVGLSWHLPDFPKCVCKNILWYGITYAQIRARETTLIILHWTQFLSTCWPLISQLSYSSICNLLN